jgi:hypothetical protein
MDNDNERVPNEPISLWSVGHDEHMAIHYLEDDSDEDGKLPPWFMPRFLFLVYGWIIGPIDTLVGLMFLGWNALVAYIMDRPASGCCGCGAPYCDVKVFSNWVDEREEAEACVMTYIGLNPDRLRRGEGYCWECFDTIPNPSTFTHKVYKGRERKASE